MRDAQQMTIQAPYLLFIGNATNIFIAKTAAGIKQWRSELCAGQLRGPECRVDLGLPDMSVAQAAASGVKTLIIGIANEGGYIPEEWVAVIVDALNSGLDVAAGLHQKLSSIAEITQAAEENGRKLHDVRYPNRSFPVGNGKKRKGKRLLTIGTDCAVGKKYTALAIEQSLRKRGLDAQFRATGQTGIFISGRGVAVDTVVADFLAGAAEWLSPANNSEHWDIVEGQGSLFHPAYAGVSLGLLHGTQPDALVLCHDPGRNFIHERPDLPFHPLHRYIDLNIEHAKLTNKSACMVGISVITAHLDENDARKLLRSITHETGLPCCDPVRFGVEEIVDAILGREEKPAPEANHTRGQQG